MKEEQDLKIKKVVENPRLSLTQFSRYCVATDYTKRKIILGAKFTGEYIPKFYDRAKGLIRQILSTNINDNDLIFDEIRRQATVLKAEARQFPVKKDDYKNREFSAEGLLALVKNAKIIIPILNSYVLNIPPGKSKTNINTVTIENVKISTKVDLLLFEDGGLTSVGFVSFNFTKRALKRQEAEHWLYVLWLYHKTRGDVFDFSKCFLVDVYSGKLYTAIDERFIEEPTRKICQEIANYWKIA